MSGKKSKVPEATSLSLDEMKKALLGMAVEMNAEKTAKGDVEDLAKQKQQGLKVTSGGASTQARAVTTIRDLASEDLRKILEPLLQIQPDDGIPAILYALYPDKDLYTTAQAIYKEINYCVDINNIGKFRKMRLMPMLKFHHLKMTLPTNYYKTYGYDLELDGCRCTARNNFRTLVLNFPHIKREHSYQFIRLLVLASTAMRKLVIYYEGALPAGELTRPRSRGPRYGGESWLAGQPDAVRVKEELGQMVDALGFRPVVAHSVVGAPVEWFSCTWEKEGLGRLRWAGQTYFVQPLRSEYTVPGDRDYVRPAQN